MNYRPLGKTGLTLSELGFGCASYWGKPRFDEKKAIELVRVAVDKGVTVFDTGHSYSQGYAEQRLAKALDHIAGSPVKNSLCISSKAGTRIANNGSLYNDFSAKWIEQSLNQSLKELKLECLGIFYLHGPNIEDFNEDLLNLLVRLKQHGLVQALGINAFDEDIIRHAAETGVFDCVMLDYNILAQDREALIAQLHGQGIAIIAAAPLAGSLYSRRIFKIKGLKDMWYLARALKNAPKKIWQGRKFRFINDFHDYTGAQIALRFVLNHPKITSAIFGSTNIYHLEENLISSDLHIPAHVFEKIESIGKRL